MSDRERNFRREKGRAVVRALLQSALEDAGAERKAALARADQQLDRIAQLLPGAHDAGIGMTDVAALTGVSRPTLYQLRGRYSDSPAHLRFAVLAGLLQQESAFPEVLAARLGRPYDELQPIFREFEGKGWIEWDPEGGIPLGQVAPEEASFDAVYPEAMTYPYAVTLDGLEALERWRLEDDAPTAEAGGA